jgi:O-antigen/teichoic acid export membrane protein
LTTIEPGAIPSAETPVAVPAAIGTLDAIRTSGGVLAGRVVGYIGSLVTLVVTARQLGADGRGAIVLIVTLVAFANILCTLGLPVAARLRLPSAGGGISLGHYLGLGALLVAGEAVLSPAAAAAFLPLAEVDVSGRLLATVAVLAALSGSLYLLVGALLAYGRLVAASFADGGGFALQGFLCVVAAALGVESFVGFVLVLAAALVPSIVFALIGLARLGHQLRPAADGPTWRRLLSTGLPSIGTAIGESATFRADRLVLGAFATPSIVGVYSVAATAAEMLRFLPASASQLVFYETARGAMQPSQLRRMVSAAVASVAAVGLAGALLAPRAVELAVGDDFIGAVTPFRILLLAELACAVYVLASSYLSGSDRVPLAARAAAVGLVVVLVADFSLIAAYGAAGAAWASVLAYGAMALAAGVLARRTAR